MIIANHLRLLLLLLLFLLKTTTTTTAPPSFVLAAGHGTAGSHSLFNVLCEVYGIRSWHWRAMCLERGVRKHRGLPQGGRPPLGEEAADHRHFFSAITTALVKDNISALLDSPVPYIYDELRAWLARVHPSFVTILSVRNATTWATSRLRDHGRTALICRESVVRDRGGSEGRNNDIEALPRLNHPFALRACAERGQRCGCTCHATVEALAQ